METPPTLKVYSAISAVSAALAKDGIAKGRRNAQQGYAFRSIDDVYAALAPHLVRHNLIIAPRYGNRTVTEQETKHGSILFHVAIDGEFDLISTLDGSKHTTRTVGEAMDSGDKATNKAMSAAFKMMCFQLFCIPTEGAETDADFTSPPELARTPRPMGNASPRPSPARMSPEEAQDADDRINEAFAARGINGTEATRIKTGLLRQFGAQNILNAGPDFVERLIGNIGRGLYDGKNGRGATGFVANENRGGGR
jgi:hypothetical protein